MQVIQDTAVDGKTVRVDDIDIGYRSFGSGPPLLMIMGYGSSMNLWEPWLVSCLASVFRVIIFDNRGIGTTGIGNRKFSMEQLADDAAGLLDALGIPTAHVLGWSMGSLIAQELVLRHPGRVEKLILYAASCDPHLFPPSADVLTQLADTSGTPRERGLRYIRVLFPEEWFSANGRRLQEVFFRPMGEIPERTVAMQAQAIDSWKGTCDRLENIRNPVFLITGSEDVLVPPANSRFLAEKIPHAEMESIEHSGHGLMFQCADLFCERVIRFIGSTSSP